MENPEFKYHVLRAKLDFLQHAIGAVFLTDGLPGSANMDSVVSCGLEVDSSPSPAELQTNTCVFITKIISALKPGGVCEINDSHY